MFMIWDWFNCLFKPSLAEQNKQSRKDKEKRRTHLEQMGTRVH